MDDIPTYRPGDTITLELDLRDDSGVGSVSVQCRGEQGNGIISFGGDGGGQKQVTLTLTYDVPEQVESGVYSASFVQTQDTLGNWGGSMHDIRFRIEAPQGDFEGPEVTDARLS